VNIGDIYAGLVLTSPPIAEPLSLADAESHLRVGSPGDNPVNDTYITALITAARQFCESILHRALITQQWRLSLKNWPGRDYQNWPLSLTSELDLYYKYNYIKLPLPPLQSVQSVTFMNSSGQVLSMQPANFQVLNGYTYNVDTDMEPGRIVLPYAQIWPTDILMPGAPIQISFTAGFIPLLLQASPPVGQTFEYWEGYQVLMAAMKLLIGEWFERRIPAIETLRSRADYLSGTEMVAQTLLQSYRIFD
jgi:hypothetical protein